VNYSNLEWLDGPWVIRPFNFRLKSKLKIDFNFWFSWFFIVKNAKVPNWKYLTIFLLVEHWNRAYISTLFLSTMKRKMKVSGNFVPPTMLQSVAWLSFPVSDASQKIENWKLKSIFNFCFSAKTMQTVDRTTPEGGGGVYWHGNFLAPTPQSRFLAVWEFTLSLRGLSPGTFATFGNVLWILCLFVA